MQSCHCLTRKLVSSQSSGWIQRRSLKLATCIWIHLAVPTYQSTCKCWCFKQIATAWNARTCSNPSWASALNRALVRGPIICSTVKNLDTFSLRCCSTSERVGQSRLGKILSHTPPKDWGWMGTRWVMNHVSSHESRFSIMSHLHHIATSDTEQSKTKVFVTLRKEKKEWNIHSLSLALTLTLTVTLSPNH